MPEFPAPINGVEQRLDALLAELRAFRAERRPAPPESVAGDGAVELREPRRPPEAQTKRRRA